MRAADKNMTAGNVFNQVYGVNFQDPGIAGQEMFNAESAIEPGLSKGDVKLLKKKLGRS
ncbi:MULTISPECIES: hypothetical protein [Heyndrickxia]|uniref:Uncharacterized protein n=2 Tax=Heyndrickxia coagulans TaxID=1398 RepID=A0A150K1Z2_HEYCO|nr:MULTISPECIES: hypothetical protein [Heyndrickxia]AEH53878.1 conserved hypothetical protein [Heyndrickxia coagulans 2-6]AJH77147.1 hypothetical protein BF29_894 [Heyndrickxia coagulans DSM 1 = ATCC 7050]KYC63268.1 hypothetical protein B4099_2900 [Heyndrickxia coagulans]KYC66207.1 hypothetical protein B4098_2755 [Heyndrickxia coagulans]MBF8417342.1 hypothetical protein [Heyndrickxia coagulans]